MNGHDNELSYWLGREAPKLLAYARQWVDSHADAEDVFQEALVRFWRRRGSVRDPRTYLYRSVRNTAMNWLRDGARSRLRARRSAEPRGQQDPAERAQQAEQWQRAQAALESLQRDDREIVALKVWSRMSFQQISEVMSVPRSTVHARYQAAMSALSAVMGKETQ